MASAASSSTAEGGNGGGSSISKAQALDKKGTTTATASSSSNGGSRGRGGSEKKGGSGKGKSGRQSRRGSGGVGKPHTSKVMQKAMANVKGYSFAADETVVAFQGGVMYKAKILTVMDAKPAANGKPARTQKVFLHYAGWSARWDEWAENDGKTVFPANATGLALFAEEQAKLKARTKKGKKRGRSAATTSTTPAPEPGAAGGSEVTAEGTGDAGGDGGGEAGSDEAAASLESDPKRPRTRKQPEVEVLSVRAETEKLKPGAINLPLPFALKKVLVDDWESVAQKGRLVDLSGSRTHTVASVLKEYLSDHRRAKDRTLQEMVAGIKLYFERALGTMLLYRFERLQFDKLMAGMDADPQSRKPLSEVYGPEHLLRLFVKLPVLLAKVELSDEELHLLLLRVSDMIKFLHKNHSKYFSIEAYHKPPPEYEAQFKGGSSTSSTTAATVAATPTAAAAPAEAATATAVPAK